MKNDNNTKNEYYSAIIDDISKWNNIKPPVERHSNRNETTESRVDLSNLDFSNKDLSGINLYHTDIRGSNFTGADLSNSDLSKSFADKNTIFNGASLKNSKLKGSQFGGAKLENVNLNGADLSGTNLSVSSLTDSDLKNIKVNTRTSFNISEEAHNCIIERQVLNKLRNIDGNNGGLDKATLAQMTIIDDFVELKKSFSGFWHTVHVTSMAFFLFPYAFFLLKIWSLSNNFLLFEPLQDMSTTIGGKLWEYIYSAGNLDGKVSPWSLITIPLILYNCLRLIILWKTVSLEHQEKVTGLPVSFTMNLKWKFIYYAVSWGGIVNVLLVAMHTYSFLSLPLSGLP
ncbi:MULTISPECIES: pentapeptide repeat-containing protein [unclassified Marinomonas]|uniref:pentapeptide repeat-containing protein n=1 Tax=unclassified Marinomonas TaxID=196814 RepID=UPI0007AFC96D|nr:MULTISPECIES: pentapeptide repeat-containing protein [unclassified Marinomonas]